MSKNIVIFVMSPFANNPALNTYSGANGFCEECVHTNETAIKYIDWELSRDGEKIDKVYAFVSQDVKRNHYCRFMELFANKNYPIAEVELYNNGDLQGSFIAICKMFDVIKNDMGAVMSDTIFHIDMTGGPRHASMLMLALLNMLRYYDARVGYVLYTNQQRKIVEDARDILDMFALMSGTQEFASYGSVEQIKRYFAFGKNKSPYMDNLLNAMEGVSEALKISSSYTEMNKVLDDLSKAIDMYKLYLESKNYNASEQEVFFAKLLPAIAMEYDEVLPVSGKPANALQIIKWCMKKEFLQQAMTLFTEWVPVYLFENKIIRLKDSRIIKEYEQHQKSQQSLVTWQNFFIRRYQHKFNDRENSRNAFDGVARAKMFQRMAEDNLVEINMSESRFTEVMKIYLKCVNKWRNRTNHASAKANGKKGNDEIKSTISNCLELLS